MINWQLQSFVKLTAATLFDVLALRQTVFILEQQCLYPDIDAVDKVALHLMAYDDDTGSLSAYLRLIAPAETGAACALGRIATSADCRGQGLGKKLVQQGIIAAESTHPGSGIKISAQQHLEAFYQGFGFVTTSAPYDEDGISHIDMLRHA